MMITASWKKIQKVFNKHFTPLNPDEWFSEDVTFAAPNDPPREGDARLVYDPFPDYRISVFRNGEWT